MYIQNFLDIIKHARDRNRDYFDCDDQLKTKIGKKCVPIGVSTLYIFPRFELGFSFNNYRIKEAKHFALQSTMYRILSLPYKIQQYLNPLFK